MTPNEEKAVADLIFELGAPHTLEEISAHTGMALRSVHRIEKRALEKMRLAVTGGWDSSLREPSRLVRRCGDVFPGDGSARRDQRES